MLFSSFLFMASLQLVAAMKARALQLGIRKWPLSHLAIGKYPGCSWPEVLGCSDDAFTAAFGGARTAALLKLGVFPTKMGMKINKKRQRFSTVELPIDEAEAVEPYCDSDSTMRSMMVTLNGS
jgi:hypothetical protein